MEHGRAEGQYVTAKTSVLWNIDNCQLPNNCDAHLIAQNIISALKNMGYMGAVAIHAYGDTGNLPRSVQQALKSTGISLKHVPTGVASDKNIFSDMLFWAIDNPLPANCLLISGDCDYFSEALNVLLMRRYNILLAQPEENVSQALAATAKSVWLWTSLLAGGAPLWVST